MWLRPLWVKIIGWRSLLYRKIATWLPRELVMRCYMRVAAHATTGKYERDTNVCDLPMMEAVKRWGE